jgi:hypothetical protein
MNRHMTDYAALPTDALGPPMRTEPEKPADGPWKPLRPGYVSRVLAGGAVEVKRTDLPVQPPKQPGTESVMHGLAEPSSAAPIEWQSGAPPSAGWREVVPAHWLPPGCHYGGKYHSYFDGTHWLGDIDSSATAIRRLAKLRPGNAILRAADRYCWRGPRLVGADWPEPETPQ